jgi:hypothetical protein
MKPIRLLGISASLLLLTGSAKAQTTFFTNGVVRNQMWTSPNQSRLNIENGVAGVPNSDTIDLTSFEFPATSPNVDNWGQRLSGLFIPAVSGNYVFFCASDDDGDLFFSTDASPANKRIIAQEASWSNYRQWVTAGGGSSLASQKRSDQWTNSAGVAPNKNGIPLVAGQKYWIEYVKHDGGGGDDAGATFKLVGDPDPANSDPSALTGNLIGYGFTIASTIGVRSQVTNATAYVGREASFTYGVTNPIPDPILTDGLIYNWYRNGTLWVSNGGPQLTFLATAGDNNAQYQCVASVNPLYQVSLSSTSVVGKLTVNTGSLSFTNGLKIERFLNHVRSDVENNSTGPANTISVSVNGAEAVVNDGINNYARRMSGWYLPPTTGSYVFFLSSDDDADLFLSTDSTAVAKTLIAQETGWSASREWTNSSGGSELSQKRSDQWTNGVGNTPFSAGISLTAGTPYYIEAVSHQGGGGDNLGVYAQLVGLIDPTNGTPPIPANQLSLLTSPTTTLTWQTQPKDTKVFEGSSPIFTATAISDSEFAVQYQWRKNGTNVAGSTSSSYSFVSVAADTGTKIDVIASTAQGGLSITSTVATLTVQQAVFEKGLALMEYWLNKGADLTVPESGAFGPADFIMAVPAFEAGLNNENGNTYVNHLSGFVVPAASGSYDFITTGDDHIDVFLSTDSNPNNKRLICQQPGWSGALAWNDTPGGGGADNNQKNSATWTNAAGVAPFANGIQLTGGNHYFLEAWHQEGGGGDSVSVTVVKHGDPVPGNGTPSTITGDLLGFNAPNTATYVNFTNQPVNQTVLSGQTATFSAGGVSDGPILIGTTGIFNTSGDVPGVGAFVKFPNVIFQWYKNGTLIPGAITSVYTTPPLKPADNNSQYYAAIRTLGIATWSNSVTAVLTVIADTNKPTAYSAVFDEMGLPVISVSFNKTMDLATISQQANYSVSGGSAAIVGITVDTNDARHVQLQLAQEPTGPITLTLSGITDFSGNTPVATTLSVATVPLVNADIGDVSVPDPAWPGAMWVDGPGEYTVIAQGSDIWGTGDAFNYSYESKTGDFDVVVRQISDTEGLSASSKGGLMVREDLTASSRNWGMNNQPKTGANSTESNTRPSAGAATVSWSTGPTTSPAFPNAWVRIKRTGQILQAFWSTNANADTWTLQAVIDVSTNAAGPLPASVYVGIDTCAHANDATTATVFRNYYTGVYANYNSAYVASTNATAPRLSASISGNKVTISWSPAGGTLQSSPKVGTGATWTTVPNATNPMTVTISGTSDAFYRVKP